MKILINSNSSETLDCGTSAAVPLVLGFVIGCFVPLGGLVVAGLLNEKLDIDGIFHIVRYHPLWIVVLIAIFVSAILILVWLFYRFKVQNGRNIVMLEKIRFETIREILKGGFQNVKEVCEDGVVTFAFLLPDKKSTST